MAEMNMNPFYDGRSCKKFIRKQDTI